MPTSTRPSWWGGVLRTLVLPAAVALLTAGGTAFALHRPWGGAVPGTLDGLGIALLAIGPLALVFRRADRVAALAVAAGAVVVYFGLGYPPGRPTGLAFAVALVSAVAAGQHHRALAVVGVATAALLGWLLLAGREVPGVHRHRCSPGSPRWSRPDCCGGSAGSGSSRPAAPPTRSGGAGSARSGCGSPRSCTTCSATTCR
ncbi:hypothetical protein [Pseudonocardia sp. NPDC049635]|uniref:hypothetical protein n=1 Tax=Pseudonocardia sp. NPDC049635 TaxID=3155506 RepID=UPI0033D97448